jgi:ORF6N domain-containing protein
MKKEIIPIERIAQAIFVIHKQKVMLDYDLAALYGVEARALNQAVKRNANRFPADFMFRLSAEEVKCLRSQAVILDRQDIDKQSLTQTSSQTVMRSRGVRYRPYAFTEQGVAMLSSVLNSERAVKVNIAIMRAFVRLRQTLETNRELARKFEQLELAVWLVLHLGWLLLFSGLLVGLHVMALKSIDGEIPRVGDLFGSLERGPAYLLALSIYCLTVSGGLVLLIIPGIYLAIRHCLFAQIITDRSASALAALRKAAELAHGNWVPLGALFLIAFLLNIAGMTLLGIELIISFQVSLLAIAGFYRSLQPAAI